ncbi:MAG: hypothetical protein Q7V57_19365 [Actinomycetota bacterium]|nr:hypothetical protein [Actinomycetota bacterium]
MEPTVVTPLPQPPPPRFSSHRAARTITLRPGHLLAGWATMFWLGWLLVGGSFGAVWYSSRVTGLSTWWLGPETEPRLFLLNIVPFVAPFGLAFLALRSARYLPWWGILGALLSAGIAAGDLADEPRYAIIEFALAAAGLLISVAAFAGMLRAASPSTDDAQGPAAELEGPPAG